MKANSDKSKQSNKATRRVLAGVLCGASVLSLALSLVMPPISQAIANDAQAGAAEKTVMEGSSSESTGVENTNNGDTENQNSDDGEGGETGSSNGDEQTQTEDQLEDELQVEDGGSSNDDAVMAAVEGGQTKTAANEIASANDLDSKLRAVGKNGKASFDLTMDVECSSTIKLDKSGSNITLNLNGHKIKYTNKRDPLFNITGGATLTVEDLVPAGKQTADSKKQSADSKPLNDQGKNLHAENYGKKAVLTCDGNGIPTYLTYYVTESVANETGTTETLNAYGANIAGAIVACDGTNDLKLVNLYDNGHFNLESGTLTQKQGDHVGNLIYAENGSTVTMNGGYICGADTGDSGAGAGIRVSNHNGKRSTFKMTNGVIAGNTAPSGAGVFAEDYVNASGANNDNESTKGHPTVEMTGGIITGNYTRDSVDGLGGGILASGGSVTVSGGYITNNKYAKFCGTDGSGDHGGGGLAANNGTHVTISGGQITGNYSEEAGGGVYVTDVNRNNQNNRDGMATLTITGGIIAANVTNRSEGAGIRVGQMVDATISGTSGKVYITNNHCMSRFDWGGGGIFVQGESDSGYEYRAGKLYIYNSYISSNIAGGYGGGVAVCPTGKTLVTNTDGTAIFGNSSAGNEQNYKSYADGNDGTPHLSSGGHEKNQDVDAYKNEVFRNNGHADFFLAAKEGHSEPIAAVTGKMLGGGDAQYKGSKELKDAIAIPANGGVQVYKSIGLSSDVKSGDPAATDAQNAATTFITGNSSWNHGGGIMSNGNLYLGTPADTYVYPSLKLKATKSLSGRDLNDGEFSFTVYRKDSADATMPSWTNGVFSNGGCTKIATAKNNRNGYIAFDLGEQYVTGVTEGKITYYLVEDGGSDLDVTYDQTVYEIAVTTNDKKTPLMDGYYIHNYEITGVEVTQHASSGSTSTFTPARDGDGYRIVPANASTFTNSYTEYDSEGSWTPAATKVVEGGEMKEFTLQLATDGEFNTIVSSKSTTAGGDNPQTQDFPTINYTLDSLKQGNADVPGRGASRTFTYYMREKNDSSIFSHYKFDNSVYKFTVVAKDETNGNISCKVTYRKGTVDSDGTWKDTDTDDHELTPKSTPTFTNTYSTSLPLSGMSGVTLTYLAGAAVLCAAAAWMHIRRKANAKGGERRE